MPETPRQADPWLPEAMHTSTSVAGYDGFWASSVAWAEVVEDAWNGGDPISRDDPTGKSWRYVSGMGEFHASVQPDPRDPTLPYSVFNVDFVPDASKFGPKGSSCTKIGFVQISWFDYTGGWHLHMVGDDIKHLHPDPGAWWLDGDSGSFYDGDVSEGDPSAGVSSNMDDGPHEGEPQWGQTRWVQMFETAAVSISPGPSYGEVYGAITWSHAFTFDSGKVIGAMRFIGVSMPTSRGDLKYFNMSGYTGTRVVALPAVSVAYGGPGSAPSPNMKPFLDNRLRKFFESTHFGFLYPLVRSVNGTAQLIAYPLEGVFIE